MRGVLDRRDRRQHRRRRHVEGSADPVHGIDDMGRAEHPADPKRRQPVNLGEGVGHHRVLGGRHQFDADLVVVARHVIGIGRVQHQQHVRRQAGAQPLDFVERQIGPGRVVRIGRHTSLVRGDTSFRIASTSAVKFFSGATTLMAPFTMVAIGYTRKPWVVEIASSPWLGSVCANKLRISSEPAPQNDRMGSSPKARPIASRGARDVPSG